MGLFNIFKSLLAGGTQEFALDKRTLEAPKKIDNLDKEISAAAITDDQKEELRSWRNDLKEGITSAKLIANYEDKRANLSVIGLKAELLKLKLDCFKALNTLDPNVAEQQKKAEIINNLILEINTQFATGIGSKSSADEFSKFREGVQNLETKVFNTTDSRASKVQFTDTKHITVQKNKHT
jgi:hypothetical protein